MALIKTLVRFWQSYPIFLEVKILQILCLNETFWLIFNHYVIPQLILHFLRTSLEVQKLVKMIYEVSTFTFLKRRAY